jgi:hypothetical protein
MRNTRRDAHLEWIEVCFPGRTKQEVLSAAAKDGFTALPSRNLKVTPMTMPI